LDESSTITKNGNKWSAVVPSQTTLVTAQPPISVSGITVCPCIAADGYRLPTALIFDKRFNLDPLIDHNQPNFVFFFNLFLLFIYFSHFFFIIISPQFIFKF
jgi:hypothetical protein